MFSKHKLFTLLIIIGLLFVQFAHPAQLAQAQATKTPDSSTQAPPGYKPTPVTASHHTDQFIVVPDVLVIQDVLPWGSTADTDVLTKLGISYDVVNISALSYVNLYAYKVVLIPSDQYQDFYDGYAANQSLFTDYVNAGGVLVLFAADQGWNGGTWAAPIPGGVAFNSLGASTDQIIDSTHPIVTDVLSEGIPLTNADLWGDNANNGFLSNLAAGTDIILEDSSGNATLVTYPLGSGKVIASGMNWEFAWSYSSSWPGSEGPFGLKALDDIFLYAAGTTPSGGSITGTVYIDDTSHPLPGARVVACTAGGGGGGSHPVIAIAPSCKSTFAGPTGKYKLISMVDGDYDLTVYPPASSFAPPGILDGLTIAGGEALTGEDVVLLDPPNIPEGTTLTPNRGIAADGTTVIVNWEDTLTLTTQGCSGESDSYTITMWDGTTISDQMTEEDGSGIYSATIPPLSPNHGYASISMTINCPGISPETTSFDIYIDPSGLVEDSDGNPIASATVTLYRSDSPGGPFTQVPDGDAMMSPANRSNPDTTDASGHFGWEVVNGYYMVRAAAPGCVSPTDASKNYVETPVLPVPPEWTNLVIQLSCTKQANPKLTLVAVKTGYFPLDIRPYAPAGVYIIDATFKNISNVSLADIYFQVAQITNSNVMVADSGPGGVGSILTSPGYPVDPDGTFDVFFVIGLQSRANFSFFVDAYGAVATGDETLALAPHSDSFRFVIHDLGGFSYFMPTVQR